MKSVGQYDDQLQMYRLEPCEPNMAKLRFLRWLAERGELEHAPAGPPAGEYAGAAERPVNEDIGQTAWVADDTLMGMME